MLLNQLSIYLHFFPFSLLPRSFYTHLFNTMQPEVKHDSAFVKFITKPKKGAAGRETAGEAAHQAPSQDCVHVLDPFFFLDKYSRNNVVAKCLTLIMEKGGGRHARADE